MAVNPKGVSPIAPEDRKRLEKMGEENVRQQMRMEELLIRRSMLLLFGG